MNHQSISLALVTLWSYKEKTIGQTYPMSKQWWISTFYLFLEMATIWRVHFVLHTLQYIYISNVLVLYIDPPFVFFYTPL